MTHPQILSNYRHAYAGRKGWIFCGTDSELHQIIEHVGALASSEETDEAVIDGMDDFNVALYIAGHATASH